MLGETEQAEREYRALVADITDERPASGSILALIGWSHFMLGEYQKAARVLSQAIMFDDDPPLRFDLALALLCAGSWGLSRQAYERGFNDATRSSALRQRGLFQVAWVELAIGVRLQPSLDGHPVVQEIRRLLTEHTSQTWSHHAGWEHYGVSEES
jgi:hypothetical protein